MLTMRIVLYENLPKMKPAEADPTTSPKKTSDPSPPILASLTFKSLDMSLNAAGIAPWSILIRMSRRNMYTQTPRKTLFDKPRSLTTSILSTSFTVSTAYGVYIIDGLLYFLFESYRSKEFLESWLLSR